jgi:hypothetical protein
MVAWRYCAAVVVAQRSDCVANLSSIEITCVLGQSCCIIALMRLIITPRAVNSADGLAFLSSIEFVCPPGKKWKVVGTWHLIFDKYRASCWLGIDPHE